MYSDKEAFEMGARTAARDRDKQLARPYKLRPKLRLKSPTAILNSSVSMRHASGIYFLLHYGQVVYVGQGVNVMARVAAHAKTKTFDRWAFVPCWPDQLDEWERAYIDALDPPLNRDRVTIRNRRVREVAPGLSPVIPELVSRKT